MKKLYIGIAISSISIAVIVTFFLISTASIGNLENDTKRLEFQSMDEEREFLCTEYDGTWNDKYKTCDESRAACMVLESEYEFELSHNISCKSGNFPDCDVLIKSISGCQFENSISQQIRENTGIVKDVIDQKKTTNTGVQGIHASAICSYVDMPCPQNPVFRTNTDLGDKLVFVNVRHQDTHYLFKIINDTLYLRNTDDTWVYSKITELNESAGIP
jgi:hypothetical protein